MRGGAFLTKSAAMLAAWTLAGCSGGDGALEKLAADADYRAAAKDSGALFFGKLSEDEAYAAAIDLDAHYLYVAFLELYPKSARRADIESRLERFRLFTAAGKKTLSHEDLRALCWPSSGSMSHWRADNSLVGMVAGAPRAYFGPMFIWSEDGSIQLISGGFADAPQGYEFEKGAQFIYTTKCLAAR